MPGPIPDTDDRVVAAMAAALHIARIELVSGKDDRDQFLNRLEYFLDAYELVLASFEKVPGDARSVLKKFRDSQSA